MPRCKTPLPQYEALPPIIQGMVTPEEYLWKTDQQKADVFKDYTTLDDDAAEFVK